MFAATQDEDGTHRLSIRRIRTIRNYIDIDGTRLDIAFTSRAKAKECADVLNDRGWYDDYFNPKTGEPKVSTASWGPMAKRIISIIHEHGGCEKPKALADQPT